MLGEKKTLQEIENIGVIKQAEIKEKITLCVN